MIKFKLDFSYYMIAKISYFENPPQIPTDTAVNGAWFSGWEP